MGKVRYTVVFPKNVAQTLEQLSDTKGMTKAEVLRRALAIYDYLQGETEDKSKSIVVRDKKNNTEKELILSH